MSKTRFLLLASALTFYATPLKAQASDVQVLTRRVEQLERQVTELERRLRAVEAPPPSAQAETRPVSGDSKQLGNWRLLRQGMTMADVNTVLGQPDRVDAGAYFVFWHYGDSGGHVTFDAPSQKVTAWSEPYRERR